MRDLNPGSLDLEKTKKKKFNLLSYKTLELALTVYIDYKLNSLVNKFIIYQIIVDFNISNYVCVCVILIIRAC